MANPPSKSILIDVANYLGMVVADDITPFNDMLCMSINSEISKLVQLGVISAADADFEIVDSSTTWADILPDEHRLSMAKTYVKIGVKLLFDPPTSSALIEALQREKDECEWRAKVAMETP